MSQASQVLHLDAPRAIDDVIDDVPPERSAPAASTVATAGLAVSAVIVALSFVLSRVLGLAREVILADEFGTGREMDAYVSAFRIPDLLFLVVMAGAFGAAFIPVFGDYLAHNDQRRAWNLASAVLTWSGVSVLMLSGVSFVLARPLMHIVAPGFDQETEDMAVNLMRILLLSPVFLGLGIAAKGILEAHNRFVLPAIAPLVYNTAIIIGALYFVDDFGVYAVGWAVIFGALGHLLVQVPGLVRAGMRYRPTLNRQVEGLGEVARLFGPRVIGLAAFQINFIAVTAFASTTGPENVSAINYAWQLLMLPHGVLALSISTVVFPTLAALYSMGQKDAFQSTLDRTLRPLLFLSIPSCIGLLLLRQPIVQVIFQNGNFDESSTELVTAPLAAFAAGLAGYALTEILTRVFYATRDTVTPVVTGVLTTILNLVLCALFMESLGYTGLALALSVTTGSEAVILLLFLRGRIGHVVRPDFGGWLVKVILAAGAMTGVILLTSPWLQDALDAGSQYGGYLLFAYAMGVYLFAFVATAWILRIPELQGITGKVTARLPHRLRSPLARLGLA
jgi:putative peptidoglycan lipid II flippase